MIMKPRIAQKADKSIAYFRCGLYWIWLDMVDLKAIFIDFKLRSHFSAPKILNVMTL